MFRVSIFFLGLLVCPVAVLATESDSQSNTVIREYPIPEHGMLVLDVPEQWNVTYYEPGDKPSPIIIFYPQEKPYDFQLTVSPLWDDGFQRDITDLAYIKNFITRVGQDTLRYSDQAELELKEIIGTGGQGYYFELSDSSAPEGEFRFLTQGALSLNDVLLVFAFFSNKDQDPRAMTTLEIMQKAVQNHQRDVHFIPQ